MKLRRVFVAVGAPLVLVVGLGLIWGVQKGSAMIKLIDAWSDSLEHSAGPVTLDVAAVPVISTLHVDGEKIGKLSQVVVLREEPGAVDSVRFLVDVGDGVTLATFDDCQLYLDPEVFDHIEGPGEVLNSLKHVVSCDHHNAKRVPFGSVVFSGMDRTESLFIEPRNHPCASGDKAACDEFKKDLQYNLKMELKEVRKLRDEIRREVQQKVKHREKVKH